MNVSDARRAVDNRYQDLVDIRMAVDDPVAEGEACLHLIEAAADLLKARAHDIEEER